MRQWWQSRTVTFYQGDWLDVLRSLPAGSVHCCVTSPPYWGLRDYGVEGQLGLEPTPAEYVAKMVAGFREVWRVLRDDGTVWLNLASSYASGKIGRTDNTPEARANLEQHGHSGMNWTAIDGNNDGRQRPVPPGFKHKDMVPIPWMVAMALQADGWYLRQDIIWAKPNPMPESVTDRCTKAHEYVFLLTKQPRYWMDMEAVKEENAEPRGSGGWQNAVRDGEPDRYQGRYKSNKTEGGSGGSKFVRGERVLSAGRNRRSVFSCPSEFARMRDDLPKETKQKLVAELLRRGIL